MRLLLVASCCEHEPGELFFAHLFTSLQILSVGEFYLLHVYKPSKAVFYITCLESVVLMFHVTMFIALNCIFVY